MKAMRRFSKSSGWGRLTLLALLMAAAVGWVAVIASRADLPVSAVTQEQVVRGRFLMVSHDCGGCHSRGNGANPGHDKWLAGALDESDFFQIGPFKTRARNLTPDNTTGLGRISERQIFNALRYGLRPSETPDVEITSTTPGQGNFPANPKYLAPPMPWPGWRHMSDQELWDIAAYLKHGIKAVENKVKDSEGPPDFWASTYTPDKIGTYPLAVYPSGDEVYTP
jgi:mono/diheme cytochrome c family protein